MRRCVRPVMFDAASHLPLRGYATTTPVNRGTHGCSWRTRAEPTADGAIGGHVELGYSEVDPARAGATERNIHDQALHHRHDRDSVRHHWHGWEWQADQPVV